MCYYCSINLERQSEHSKRRPECFDGVWEDDFLKNGVWGLIFTKKISNFRKHFSIYFVSFSFLCYYCSINLKRQSEHSRLCSDTSSLVVPTFVTKETEYLCSGWVFFLQTIFEFLTSHFWQNFFTSFESYCCLKLKFEKIFHLWIFFVNLRGFWRLPFWPILEN